MVGVKKCRVLKCDKELFCKTGSTVLCNSLPTQTGQQTPVVFSKEDVHAWFAGERRISEAFRLSCTMVCYKKSALHVNCVPPLAHSAHMAIALWHATGYAVHVNVWASTNQRWANTNQRPFGCGTLHAVHSSARTT